MRKAYSYYIAIGLSLFMFGFFGIYKIMNIQGEEMNIDNKNENSEEKMGELNEDKNVEFTIAAGGDVMMSRHVGTKIRESGDDAMPFRKIADIFSQADIAFVNLESPFYDQGDYVTEGMVFKTEPEYIAGLNLAGIDMVSLANNHMRNRGQSGLIYTMDYLEKNNIKYSGAGRNFNEAHQAGEVEIDGLRIAFLSYTYSDGNDFTSSVSREDPDVAFMDVEQMITDVNLARENNDIIIVSMHAGVEYKHYPNQQQEEFAHAAIESGAELVLGHHPHVVQSVEQYGDGFIVYSLGNLVFDQMWSEDTREGVIARCNFVNSNIENIEFIPIKIENYSQPRLATEAESGKILRDMGLESDLIILD